MVSSNGFRHFSQMNAYLGMAVTSPVSMLRVWHSSNVSTPCSHAPPAVAGELNRVAGLGHLAHVAGHSPARHRVTCHRRFDHG
jgi:hypothetical protein